jgi:hypothetical protein
MFEPLSAWRQWVTAARGLLDVAAALHRKQNPTTEQWGRAFAVEEVRRYAEARLGLEPPGPAQRLVGAINGWMALGQVHPRLAWDEHGARVEHSGFGVFGALALQLAAAVGRSDGWASCAGCGEWFSPKRRATKGNRRYCDRCRDAKVPQRDAARDLRERRRNSS